MKSIINVLIVVGVAIVFSLVLMMGLPAYSVWQPERPNLPRRSRTAASRSKRQRRILRRRN